MAFPGLQHVAITVSDLDASTQWYTRLFGADPVLDEDEEGGEFHHVVYALDGGLLFGLHTHMGREAKDRADSSGQRGGRFWRHEEEIKNVETFGEGRVDGDRPRRGRGGGGGGGGGGGYRGRGGGGYGRGGYGGHRGHHQQYPQTQGQQNHGPNHGQNQSQGQ